MNMPQCTHERDVITAAKSQNWTSELQHHVKDCSFCQETLAMTTMMKNIATNDTKHALPSYRLIWLTAQYARKQERLSTLDLIALIGMSLTGIAAVLGLLLWRFPQLFGGILKTTETVSWTSLSSNGAPLAVIGGAFIMIWLLTRDSFFAER